MDIYYTIGQVVFNLQNLSMLASFLFAAFIFFRRLHKKHNMGLILLYSLLSFLVMSTGTIVTYLFDNDLVFLNKLNIISVILHYALLAWFIVKSIDESPKITARIIGVVFFLLLIFSIIALLSQVDNFRTHYISYAVSSLGLLLLCLLYFVSLLRKPIEVELKLHPTFWVIVAVFLHSGIQLPFSSTVFFVYMNAEGKYDPLFLTLVSMSFFFLHLFFIKAYQCLVGISRY